MMMLLFAMQRTNKSVINRLFRIKKQYRDMLREGNHCLHFLYLKRGLRASESRLKSVKVTSLNHRC